MDPASEAKMESYQDLIRSSDQNEKPGWDTGCRMFRMLKVQRIDIKCTFRPRARHAVSSEERKVNLVGDTVGWSDPGPLAEVYRLLVDASSRPKIKFDGTSTEKVCASGCWRFDSPVPRVKLDSR